MFCICNGTNITAFTVTIMCLLLFRMWLGGTCVYDAFFPVCYQKHHCQISLDEFDGMALCTHTHTQWASPPRSGFPVRVFGERVHQESAEWKSFMHNFPIKFLIIAHRFGPTEQRTNEKNTDLQKSNEKKNEREWDRQHKYFLTSCTTVVWRIQAPAKHSISRHLILVSWAANFELLAYFGHSGVDCLEQKQQKPSSLD